jgi:hypothetical protein
VGCEPVPALAVPHPVDAALSVELRPALAEPKERTMAEQK